LLPFDKAFKNYQMGRVIKYIDAGQAKAALMAKPSKEHNNPKESCYPASTRSAQVGWR
jgi:hypothetical protein